MSLLPVSQVPKECWLLSRGYFRIWGSGVSFEPEKSTQNLALPLIPCHPELSNQMKTRWEWGECVCMYVNMMCIYIHIRRHMHVQVRVCVHVCPCVNGSMMCRCAHDVCTWCIYMCLHMHVHSCMHTCECTWYMSMYVCAHDMWVCVYVTCEWGGGYTCVKVRENSLYFYVNSQWNSGQTCTATTFHP